MYCRERNLDFINIDDVIFRARMDVTSSVDLNYLVSWLRKKQLVSSYIYLDELEGFIRNSSAFGFSFHRLGSDNWEQDVLVYHN